MRVVGIAGLLLAGFLPAAGQNAGSGEGLKKLEFVLGKWVGAAGEKDTPLGAGQGGFSFEAELNGKVIVRRNYAAYDAGQRHEDLMVIYLEGGAHRAIYFDTEGHVIRYHLTFPGANRVTFESEGAGPRYRLSYWLNGTSLDGKFEVAPPGGEYKAYMNWTSRKK